MANRNMRQWVADILANPVKKAMPILSFPCVALLHTGVRALIMDSALQAEGMRLIAERTDALAAVSMMDLSVEAEAFGAQILVTDDEVPTVIGHLVADAASADALLVPAVGAGRTGLYVAAIERACRMIADRPVFAGVIGPFSLAGRLMDVSEAMVYCYDEPEMVHTVLQKATDFLIDYIEAYKAAGADGVIVAEPLAGLLTPALNAEFSAAYMKRIVDAVQSERFLVVYHNCGGGTPFMIDALAAIGAAAYHFGNAIDLSAMAERFPADRLIMGNIDPAGEFRNGTPASVRTATRALLDACAAHPNFVVSSGCDIPPLSSWDNIDAFFAAVSDFYAARA